MKNRRWWCVAALVGLLAGAAAAEDAGSGAQPSPQDQAKMGAAELATRFEYLAQGLSHDPKPTPALFKQVAALYQAAARLDPSEARFARSLTQTLHNAGDGAGELAALKTYLTLVPDDQVGQCELIDLYVERMQTADAQLNYLRGLLAKTALPAPVRSYAAVRCSQTFMSRSQQDEAVKMLDTALQLDPLNRQALGMKYELTRGEGASRRCGLLLAMIRSNPIDPGAATALAGQLADEGLVNESVSWYVNANALYAISGRPRSPELGKAGAAELFVADHPKEAMDLVGAYLQTDPRDAEAWGILLAIQKEAGADPAEYDKLARGGATNVGLQFQLIRSSIGASNAATQPSTSAGAATRPLALPPTTLPNIGHPAAAPSDVAGAPPDMSGDMALLVKDNRPRITDAYVAAAQDAAWLRLYFLRDAGPGTDAILEELGKLLPDDDAVMARLLGWRYLVLGRGDEARQKLLAVADRDPYAGLGLVVLDEQEGKKAAADAAAKSLMAAHPSGPAAAVLYSALRPHGAKVIAIGQSAAVQAALAAFPQDWISIVNRPQQFYSVTIDPLSTDHAFAEAMLARVTIENISNYDLTVGEGGTLRPELVFEANLRGLLEKGLGPVASERLWKRRVLPVGQSLSQVVRLDQGDLARLLDTRPDLPLTVSFAVTTNPIGVKGGIAAGGAGYRVQAGSLAERAGTPFQTADDRTKLYNRIASGPPADRICAAETMFALAPIVASAPGGGAGRAAAQDMVNHLGQATNDPDPSVRAWATFLQSNLATGEQGEKLAKRMASSDDWTIRLLALVGAQAMPDKGQAAAATMSNDGDPVVKAYAAALADYLRQKAAAAATRPTSSPAPPPGAAPTTGAAVVP